MTLCVGALVHPDAYVCVSDMKLTGESEAGSFGQETAFSKTGRVARNWLLSYSGVSSNYMALMTHLDTDVNTDYTMIEVMGAIKSVYDKQRFAFISDLLAKYCVEPAFFVKSGREAFGDPMYRRIWGEIEDGWQLDCMLGGVDGGNARLMVLNEGGWHYDSVPGFAAIGIGTATANTVLYRSYDYHCRSIGQTAARLLEAKFTSEVSPHIGGDTTVWVVTPDGAGTLLDTELVDDIRVCWKDSVETFYGVAAKTVASELD